MNAIFPMVTAVLMLTGCGAPHVETVQQARQHLMGASTETLDACIGEPQSITAQGAGAVWRFSSAQTTDETGRFLQNPPADPMLDRRACVFDFTIADGRVVAISSDNRAGWGFGNITNCSRIIRRCIAR